MDAFISHSKKDAKIVNSTFKICQRAKIKPNIAEFEEIERGKIGAKKIRDMIDKSELFFLFLSENVVNDKDYRKTIYTQNWVNFELGCVYAQKKVKKKFIYVFEPFTQLHFPIPYLDYYILYDPNYDPHWDFIEEVITQEREFSEVTKSLNPLLQTIIAGYRLQERLKGRPVQRPSEYRGFKIHHKICGAEYVLLSKPEQWLCPICRKPTIGCPS
jgi:hypothetical protein